jgi:ADP-ribosyl-[dinitrogen reductase] hydrolase
MDAGRDRAVASVLGLAIGDALGAPFEFTRSTDLPHPLPAFTRSWMGLPPGTWTDDTAMARNLWLSLIAHGGELDTEDVLARHVAWLRTGPPDVGTLTRRVLSRAADGVTEAAREYVEQRGPEVSAGNGSVMYCAPLGVVHAATPERLDALAPALSCITHWDARCRTACVAVTRAAAGLVRGEDPETTVVAAVAAVIDREGGEELEFLVGEAGRGRPVDGPDMGFTLFTAGLALQVAGEGRGFEEGLRYVVSLGGDTDTNAAVAGALLGAAHGTEALPPGWLAGLAERDLLTEEARSLAALVGGGMKAQ